MSDSPHSEKLLIVDDDRNICALMFRLLKSFDYEVEIENDARQVLNRVREDQFDLVMVDLVMPHIGGLELVIHIKKEFPNLPVIVMTSFASIQSARKAMRAGADDFVTKPIKGEFWDMRIRKILDKETSTDGGEIETSADGGEIETSADGGEIETSADE